MPSGRMLKVAWVIALLGLVVAATARFLNSPLDGATVLWAIVLGVLLSFVLVFLGVWLITLPVAVRNRALRASHPESEILLAAELSADIDAFLVGVGRQHKRSSLLPVTIVLSQESLNCWDGTAKPVQFASIPRASIEGIELTRSSTGVRSATGVKLHVASSTVPLSIEFVPVERLGNPVSRQRVTALRDSLESWFRTT